MSGLFLSNADRLAASVLIVGCVVALFVGTIVAALFTEDRRDRRARAEMPLAHRTPAEEAAWETHVATTPGVADAEIEACDLAMWELEGNYPQVYDAEDFGGPAS